jgi:hypothetical protein
MMKNKNKPVKSTATTRLFGGILILLGLATSACGPELEVNFLLNASPLQAFEGDRPERGDSLHVMSVLVGDTIYLDDISQPAKKIRTRAWDLNDDGNWDVEGKAFFETSFSRSGFYKITLCVNGKDACAHRWVYAEEPAPIMEAEEPEMEEEPEAEEPEEPKVTSTPPPKPPPIRKPPPKPKPTFEGLPDEVGVLRSGVVPSCQTIASSSFETILKVKREVQLGSFAVYTDQCGGLDISLTGPGTSIAFKAGLVNGLSQIDLAAHTAARLAPGSYTLKGKTFRGGAGCEAEEIPRFKHSNNCNAKQKPSQALDIDQKGTLIIHQLKFEY